MRRHHRIAFALLARRIKLKDSEIKEWNRITNRFSINIRNDGVIEQFDGYFRKSRVRVTEFNEFGIPQVAVGLDLKDIGKTQFIKQADVVMLQYLLANTFGKRSKDRNYAYYIAR